MTFFAKTKKLHFSKDSDMNCQISLSVEYNYMIAAEIELVSVFQKISLTKNRTLKLKKNEQDPKILPPKYHLN